MEIQMKLAEKPSLIDSILFSCAIWTIGGCTGRFFRELSDNGLTQHGWKWYVDQAFNIDLTLFVAFLVQMAIGFVTVVAMAACLALLLSCIESLINGRKKIVMKIQKTFSNPKEQEKKSLGLLSQDLEKNV